MNEFSTSYVKKAVKILLSVTKRKQFRRIITVKKQLVINANACKASSFFQILNSIIVSSSRFF